MTSLVLQIKKRALDLGFHAVGITHAGILENARNEMQGYLDAGFQGEMFWLKETHQQRCDPRSFFPDAESVVMVALNYFRKAEAAIMPPESGNISIYARGRDYHKVMRQKLRKLFNWITGEESRTRGKIFVDSFPLVEKPLAVRAGLGWIGKNTTLILPQGGSFFFLGGILLNLPLPADPPQAGDFCGTCRRCTDACPTRALIAPFRLDARKCISYLTIEHQSSIAEEFHREMGNHIFGCDICQMVCPWNIRFSRQTTEPDFTGRWSSARLNLKKLKSLSPEEYAEMFEGMPVRRTGYQRFLRNVQIAWNNLQASVRLPFRKTGKHPAR